MLPFDEGKVKQVPGKDCSWSGQRFANHPQSRPAAGRSGAPVARGLTSAIRLEPLRAAEAKPATGVTEAIVG